MGDYFIGTCDQCGALTDVMETNDPFLEEVYGEITDTELWCDNCYGDRREEA